MTIRDKTIYGNDYTYEQQSIRLGNKVTTKHIRYIGKSGRSSSLGTTSLTTTNINKSGFIKSNGDMIDMSEGTDKRELSHREYLDSVGYKGTVEDYLSETKGMRINTERNYEEIYIETESKPTKAQMDIIKKNHKGKRIIFEYGNYDKSYNDYNEFESDINKME